MKVNGKALIIDMSLMKNLLVIGMCMSHLLVNAQVPFEKKGKWGIINENGKTLVKPKYESLKTVDLIENRFIVQGKVKRPFENDKLCYGVIDSSGKQIIPITADSIEVIKNGFIAFISEGTPINETHCRLAHKTNVYDGNGNIQESVPGMVTRKLPGGFIVCSDTRGYGKMFALYSKNFTKIDEVEGFEDIRQDALITFERQGGRSEYTYWDNLTLTPILKFNTYRLLNNNNDIIIISDSDSSYGSEDSYGYISFKDNTYQEPIFTSKKQADGSYAFYKNNEENECFILNLDGSFSDAISYTYTDKSQNVKQLVFKKNEAGLFRLDDLEVSDIVQFSKLPGLISIQKDGKWGLYNFDEKVFEIPFVLSGPVSNMNKGYLVTLTGDDWNTSSLCDIEGNKIFDVSSEHEINLENVDSGDVFTYRRNGLKTTGIYSLSNKKWLFEPDEYTTIYTISNDRYAVEVSPNKYNYITKDGVILNTLENVADGYFSFQDFTDFLRVSSTSGKMGLLNKRTGKWIVPCKFDMDFTFGGGSGADRKIAVQETTSNGETITVYTVSGRKVASQFFPFGIPKRSAHIRAFGEKYLNH
ncbi:MAG: WG repeat-containing protein [Muribaculaceae bacterium]|nr:WG repeat-containing protein [Muribaculaceae bacterium]